MKRRNFLKSLVAISGIAFIGKALAANPAAEIAKGLEAGELLRNQQRLKDIYPVMRFGSTAHFNELFKESEKRKNKFREPVVINDNEGNLVGVCHPESAQDLMNMPEFKQSSKDPVKL